jgi:thymidine kinase
MAQVYYYYSAMNAGKSTSLLQSSYNYNERGMETLLLKSAVDQRVGPSTIASRIGLSSDCHEFTNDTELFEFISNIHSQKGLACVFVDECQFLTEAQVRHLCSVADDLDVPVLCYGLRTDFQGNLFEGSKALLALADRIHELKTICHCGKKATMNLRMGPEGKAVKEGAQVEIGGNERYVALCRKHWMEAMK